MKTDEFQEWFDHHAARFPGVSHWLAKFPDEKGSSEFQPTKAAILDAWCGILRDVALFDAKKASDQLASGDEEFREKGGFDHHPRDVRRLANAASAARSSEKRRKKYYGGEPTFSCLQCEDSGYIKVVMPVSVRAAVDGKLQHPIHNPEGSVPFYLGVSACNCNEGCLVNVRSQHVRPGESKPPPMLTADKCLIVTWIDEDWWPFVMQFAESTL